MTKRQVIAKIVYAVGMICAVVPPLIAFLDNFPVLTEQNYGQAVSWFAVAMIAVCCIPFWRRIKEYFKSPDTAVPWLVSFIVFTAVKNLIDGMIIVTFWGLIGNLIAKGLFFAAHRLDPPKKKEDDE